MVFVYIVIILFLIFFSLIKEIFLHIISDNNKTPRSTTNIRVSITKNTSSKCFLCNQETNYLYWDEACPVLGIKNNEEVIAKYCQRCYDEIILG